LAVYKFIAAPLPFFRFGGFINGSFVDGWNYFLDFNAFNS
jgi:hypothetical protein